MKIEIESDALSDRALVLLWYLIDFEIDCLSSGGEKEDALIVALNAASDACAERFGDLPEDESDEESHPQYLITDQCKHALVEMRRVQVGNQPHLKNVLFDHDS